jgi:hypothetical protein
MVERRMSEGRAENDSGCGRCDRFEETNVECVWCFHDSTIMLRDDHRQARHPRPVCCFLGVWTCGEQVPTAAGLLALFSTNPRSCDQTYLVNFNAVGRSPSSSPKYAETPRGETVTVSYKTGRVSVRTALEMMLSFAAVPNARSPIRNSAMIAKSSAGS